MNIPRRNFTEGFPGITDRFEWFAIDYTGSFWIGNPGKYRFALLSDDGSRLYIDGRRVIDNDGVHPVIVKYAIVKLIAGRHRIRVSYFQGPRAQLALVLGVAEPGADEFSIFDMRKYHSPQDVAGPK